MPERSSRPTVVVLGGINMDLVAIMTRIPDPGETVKGGEFLTYPGGKGANQAVAAARLGASVRMVGRVGNDGFGDSLMAGMSSHGIDVTGVSRDSEHASGVAVILLDEQRQNRIMVISGANETCDHVDIETTKRPLRIRCPDGPA